MDINQVYSLASGKFIEPICAIDNLFIRQLINLTTESAKNLKVVSFILRDKAQNRGEIQQRGIHPSEKSVIDICKLTPLVGTYGSRTLKDEIAHYRAETLGFHAQDPSFAKNNAEMLMIDYVLSACLCYVEVFDGSAKVDKFFATRNRFIAGGITGLRPEETSKYTSYLQAFQTNYTNRQIKVLKLSVTKNGFRIVQPRSYLDFNNSVRVTPLFFMTSFVEGIMEILRQGIVRFKYIKDNLTEREFISTVNPEILLKYYDQEFVQMVLSNMGTTLHRGYIKLPELGISKYDATGVRALNVSRITSVEVITEFDTRFIDVDFDMILPTFKETLDQIKNPQILAMMHEDLVGKPPQTNHIAEIRNSLSLHVDGQYAIGTTTALRYLHIYMVQRPQIFTTYNGGKRREFSGYGNNFNLGGAN